MDRDALQVFRRDADAAVDNLDDHIFGRGKSGRDFFFCEHGVVGANRDRAAVGHGVRVDNRLVEAQRSAVSAIRWASSASSSSVTLRPAARLSSCA